MSCNKFQHVAFTSPFSLPIRPTINQHTHLTSRRHSIIPISIPVTPSVMTHTVSTASDGDMVFSTSAATTTSTTTTHTNVPDDSPVTSERPFESTSLNTSMSKSGLSTVSTSITDMEDNIFSIEDITQIIDAVEDSDLADFRYEHDGVFVEITRAGGLGFNVDGHLQSPPTQTTISPQSFPPPLQYTPTGNTLYNNNDDDNNDDVDEMGNSIVQEDDLDDHNDEIENDHNTEDPDQIYDTDFVVKSNRVGFFFSGAKNKPPLVNLGDTVAFNQPVCIIEQLGQQYVYLSEASGKVVKVFVEDGDGVEFGTQIMVIRPD